MEALKTYKKRIAEILLFVVVTSFVFSVSPHSVNAGGEGLSHAETNAIRTQYREATVPEIDFGCSMKKDMGAELLINCMGMLTYYVLYKPIHTLFIWAGIFFNYVLLKLVVSMGQFTENIGGLGTAWEAMRDLANIVLVFLMVYVGIATILGISGYGAKQMLWKIIIAALFVNFSITLTKAVIDVGNYFSYQIYHQFTTSPQNGVTITRCTQFDADGVMITNPNEPCLTDGIAGAFSQRLKMTTPFSYTGEAGRDPLSSSFDRFIGLFMAVVFVGVFAFLLVVAGLLLVARFVLLLFLLIVSPFALTMLLLGVSSLGKQWWSMLIKQSFFAPALLLMWWIAWLVISSDAFDATQGLTETASLDPSAYGTMMTFVIAIGFLIAGLIIAQKLGAYGATASIRIGRGLAVAAGTGLAGFGAAYTVGAASSAAQRRLTKLESKAHERNEDGTHKRTDVLSRFQRTKVGSKAARGVNTAVGAGANMKLAKTKSYNERKEASKKATESRQKEIDAEVTKRKFKDVIGDKNADPQKVRGVVEKATHAQLLENAEVLSKNPRVTGHLPQSTFNQLIENKDGKFTAEQLASFKKERKDFFKNLEPKEVSDFINKAKPKDLVEHDVSFLGRKEVVERLDTRTMNGLIANGLTQEKREAMRAQVERLYKDLPRGGAGVLGSDGQPIAPQNLTSEQSNIVQLYEWFNNPNRPTV